MTELQKEEIYVNYKNKVEAYIYTKIADKYDVEDLVSAVFEKVYRNIDAYDEKKASVSTWIYSITRNTAIDYFRTAKKTIPFDIESINDYSFSPHINTDIVLEELACALAKLDIRQRDLIILHYYDGKTFKEIATVFGISYIYTKVLHKKALQNIKNLMIH